MNARQACCGDVPCDPADSWIPGARISRMVRQILVTWSPAPEFPPPNQEELARWLAGCQPGRELAGLVCRGTDRVLLMMEGRRDYVNARLLTLANDRRVQELRVLMSRDRRVQKSERYAFLFVDVDDSGGPISVCRGSAVGCDVPAELLLEELKLACNRAAATDESNNTAMVRL